MNAFRATALAAAGLGVALLAGCSTVEKAIPRPSVPPQAAATREPPPPLPPPEKLKPMPVRPFTIRTDCRFKDEAGSFGKALVEVDDSRVRAFNVEITMPKRGSCRYDLAEFKQTQALPSIELKGPRDCRVRMWEQGRQITVAFSACHKLCSPASAHDYVWPLLIDKPTGRCD